jgi:UDP-3-O-[3-hydroxymyristoyl] glucosamine N-acyltransferase
MMFTLGQIAEHIGAQLRGDADYVVDGVATLASATSSNLSFLANSKYRTQLASARAGVVVLSAEDAESWSGNALIARNPYLAYAKAAALLHPQPVSELGVHASAQVHASAKVSDQVSIGAGAVIAAEVSIGAKTTISAGVVLAESVVIGENCWIGPNVTILHHCQLGNNVVVESGTVIGSEGFGWAKDGARWVKVPQIGRVIIGNDVSIGANCCLDRGAIEDTVIEDGVKLDNFVQISHNVRIGQHTAMAGHSGVAGSTQVGQSCTIAGMAGVAGHLTLADNVHVTAMTLVSRSLSAPGVYSGNLPVEENALWRKNVARFRQLEAMAKRLKALEKQAASQQDNAEKAIND